MRLLGWVAAVALLGGCTTVRLSQREGCWIRETSKTFAGTKEEVGPCARPPVAWVADRYTRLIQECVAQAESRWMSAALAAWEARSPMPEPDSREAVLQKCIDDATRAMMAENDVLRHRLAEANEEREALRKRFEEDYAAMREGMEKLVHHLGEAAKKAGSPAVATATATSDGSARTESGMQSALASGAKPMSSPPRPKRALKPRPAAVEADLPACDPAPAGKDCPPAAGAESSSKPPAQN